MRSKPFLWPSRIPDPTAFIAAKFASVHDGSVGKAACVALRPMADQDHPEEPDQFNPAKDPCDAWS
jgi:hypothetical protein